VAIGTLTKAPATTLEFSVRRMTRSPFVVEFPLEAKRVGRLVELALHHILRAAIVEPKDFIVQVQSRYNCRQAPAKVIAGLRVHLEVRVKIVVTGRTFDVRCRSNRDDLSGVVWIKLQVLVLILENIRAVVSQTNASLPPSMMA